VWEDWLWYAILPCGTYATLALAAGLLGTTTEVALFVIAGLALGLLLIGIHSRILIKSSGVSGKIAVD
jgi:hypothetical protein